MLLEALFNDEAEDTKLVEAKYSEASPINLADCRMITSDVVDVRGELEASACLEYNGELTRVQVRTVIIRDTPTGKEFLGRRYRSRVSLPGGGYDLNKDSTILDTAVREAYEEFNLKLTGLRDTGIRVWSHREDSWVATHIQNEEDRWTGYYTYYVIAEVAGIDDNENPEEINSWRWLPIKCLVKDYENIYNCIDNINEAFDNEQAYGEGARTIPGILRYFTSDLKTLNLILDSRKIKASDRLEPDPEQRNNTGKRGRPTFKERPFVSFSKQLFSHAFRNPRKWRYGVAIDLNKLEASTKHLDKASKFEHTGSRTQLCVYGAVRLVNGVEILITSYGTYRISLTPEQLDILQLDKDTYKNSFYDEIKQVFDRSGKKYYTDLARLKSAVNIPIEAEIAEGFCTGFDNHAVAVDGKKIYKYVPELWEFLHAHTPIDEGEYRVWLEDGQDFLDISSCICGVVLPSNYESENNAEELDHLKKYISDNNLETYIYDACKLPWTRKKGRAALSNNGNKVSIEEFFEKITASYDDAVEFIKTFSTSKQARTDYSTLYNSRVASATTIKSPTEVAQNKDYNYRAFLNATGLTSSVVSKIVKEEKAASAEMQDI
jgi:8-oxo-dGTP pyrophosphatase MutT (NUDIX family)